MPENRFGNGPLDVPLGYESDGEGVSVYRVLSSTVLMDTATIASNVSVVQGAWLELRSFGGYNANKPVFWEIDYSGATLYYTGYDRTGGAPSSSASFDVYVKGIR